MLLSENREQTSGLTLIYLILSLFSQSWFVFRKLKARYEQLAACSWPFAPRVVFIINYHVPKYSGISELLNCIKICVCFIFGFDMSPD